MTTRRALISLLVLATSHASYAVTISDDFNDGNDTGWTRYQPLQPFDAGGTYSFPGGNSYSIAAPVSPNPGGVGPARAGSFRNDGTYTDFNMRVDILDWDTAQPDMIIGLLGRTTNIGLGTTNGYAVLLDVGGTFGIQVIAGEQGTTVVGTSPVALSPIVDYRIVFNGSGQSFSAELYDLTNLGAPLVTVSGTDGTYASGVNGIFVYDGSGGGSATARATFDNYLTATPIPEPSALAFAGLTITGLLRRRRAPGGAPAR